MRRLLILFVSLMLVAATDAQESLPAVSLLDELTTTGVAVSPSQSVSLPKPLEIVASTSLDSLGGRFGWAAFGKNSVNAPVWLELNYILSPDGSRIGQQISFRFVVHVDAKRLLDNDWADGLLPTKPSDGVTEDDSSPVILRRIASEEAKRLGLVAGSHTSFNYLTLNLLNRVIASGVIRSTTSTEEAHGVVTWQLIDVTADTSLASQWRKIERDDLGKKRLGPPHSYQGASGYVAVHSLATIEPVESNVSLIEGALIFHEPTDWFGGNNFLRSKFPLLLQESVRNWRRELKKTNEE